MIGIYVRVSTTDQSTQLQLNEIGQYIKLRGLGLQQKIYDDSGISGTTSKRPALKQLIQDCREKKISTVVIWKLDRLFRSLKDLILTLQEMSESGIQFISIKDNIDLTSASGRLYMHMIGAFAEFEAALIKERVKAGMNNAKIHGTKSGKPIGRQRVYDYNLIKRSCTPGKSYGAICRELGVSKGAVSRAKRLLIAK